MGKSSKTRFLKESCLQREWGILGLLLACLLTGALRCAAADQGRAMATEAEIRAALTRMIPCKSLGVKIDPPASAPGNASRLILQLNSAKLGRLMADHITVSCRLSDLNLEALRRTGAFTLRSNAQCKIGILISPASLQAFFDATAAEYHKKYSRLVVKFTPPYIESEFDIPISEFSGMIQTVLRSYNNQGKVSGYSCVKLSARANKLYCHSEKTIFQHFLLPKDVVQILEKRWNPFYEIPLLQPFRYSIENIAVQKNYIYLSN